MPNLQQRQKKRDEKVFAAAAALPSGASLPVCIKQLTRDTLPMVARLHRKHLGINYAQDFFESALGPDSMAKVALWQGIIVGSIICREVPTAPSCLWVRSIVVSVPRRHVGSCLLQDALAEAQYRGIRLSRLHVHVRNLGAIAMYESMGYKLEAELFGYYHISGGGYPPPPDALLMLRKVTDQEGAQ